MMIDKHTLALISIIGGALDMLGALYLAYDLLGGNMDHCVLSPEESPTACSSEAGTVWPSVRCLGSRAAWRTA